MLARYVLRKILLFLLSLLSVTTLTFFLMHALPGDPFLQEQAIPQEIMAGLRKFYGLDKPLLTQYFQYIWNLLHGDLGPSFKYESRSVLSIISDSFPFSFVLGLEALTIAIGTGVGLGVLSALKRNTWVDKLVMLFSVALISTPNFIFASGLQYIFALKLNLFPVARWGSFWHSVLPALSLAALPTAYIARLTRANVMDVLEEEYIITARSKGISTTGIVLRHILKNALLPVVTYVGPLASSILTGSFIIEKIFGIPGLGNWFVTSITNRDYTVIMGVTLFYSFFLLSSVLLVDLIYPMLDPRITFDRRNK